MSCGPHRPPEGPNEDVAVCYECLSVSYVMRPENETFGAHLPDCSLPIRHEKGCIGGGSGHPRAEIIRGFWPRGLGWHDADCLGGRHEDDGTCPTTPQVMHNAAGACEPNYHRSMPGGGRCRCGQVKA